MKLIKLSRGFPCSEGREALCCQCHSAIHAPICGLWIGRSSSLVRWVSSGPSPSHSHSNSLQEHLAQLLPIAPSFATSTHSHLCKLSCSSSQTESYGIKSSLSFSPSAATTDSTRFQSKGTDAGLSLCLSLSAPGRENPKQLKEQVRQTRKYSRRAHMGQQQGECMQKAKGKNPGKETT